MKIKILFLVQFLVSVSGNKLSTEIDKLLNTKNVFSSVTNVRNGKSFGNYTNLVEVIQSELSNEKVLNKVYKKYEARKEIKFEEGENVQQFKENVLKIAKHNIMYKNGQTSYEQGINDFTDYENNPSLKSISTQITPINKTSSWYPKIRSSRYLKHGTTSHLDWRSYGVITTPKNQGKCGSCTFFASVAALEAHHNLINLFTRKHRSYFNNNYELDLSEQELLDCARNYTGYQGCTSNLPSTALEYMKQQGLSREYDYYYRDSVGEFCRKGSSSFQRVKLDSYYMIRDEKQLKTALREFGPVIAWIKMSQELRMYKRGVFDTKCVDPNGISHNIFRDHLVLVVGYSDDYWIVKNSYGDKWGEQGYFRMKRGKQLCLIGEESYFLFSGNSKFNKE